MLHKGYCISCGNELEEYVLSLAGLFADKKNLEYMRRAFLRGEIVFVEDKLRESAPMKDFFEGNNQDAYDFIRREKERIPRLIMNNDLGFYLDYDEDEELLAGDIDETDAIVKNKHCIVYFWVKELVDCLYNIITKNGGGNRIMQALLSTSGVNVSRDFYHIDLKKKITAGNVQQLIERIAPAIDGGIYNATLIQEVKDIDELMSNFLDCVEKCEFRFERGNPPEINFETIKDEREGSSSKYVKELMVNQRSVFQRICPNCGAHIPSKLCIYPQKIISFVGSACSGKSTLINAIFSRLNNISRFHIPGIICDFAYKDPNYKVYSDAFENAVNNYIAVRKTEVGTYPTLTVTLRSGENGEPVIYTFVDVPGELFGLRDSEDGETHFSRIRIMRHSDIICLTIAAEQLIGKRDDGTGKTKAVTNDAMNELRDILSNFRIQLGQSFNGQLHMVVTKIDGLKPCQEDFSQDSDPIWLCNGVATDITKTEIDGLFSDLAQMPVIRNADRLNNSEIYVQAKELISLQYRSHKFIKCFSKNIPALTAIVNSFDIDMSSLPIFMTAAFGFYALDNIWQLSEKEIRTALENINREELDDHVLKKSIKIIEDHIIDHHGKGDLKDQLGNDGKNETIDAAQLALGLTAVDIEKLLIKSYKEEHEGTTTYGINAFLMWLFIETGLVRYLYKLPAENDSFSEYAGKVIWSSLPLQRNRFKKVTILSGDNRDQMFAEYADDELEERKILLNKIHTAEQQLENAEADYKGLNEALREKYGDNLQRALESFRHRGDRRLLDNSHQKFVNAKKKVEEFKRVLEEYDHDNGIDQLR